MFQFNDAAAIQAGMGLVPNLRDQMVQDATLKLQQRQVAQDEAVLRAKLEEQKREVDLGAAYERDLEAALLEGTPSAIRRLQTKYPALTKDAKEAFDALDEETKTTTLTQMGAIYERANGGDIAGAADKLEQRIAADKAAGEETADDEEILAGLRSNDPTQQRIAVATMAFGLRAIAGDKFDAVTQAMEPDRKTPEELQYEFDVRTYGKPYADQAKLARDSKTLAVQPGGRIDVFGPDPSLMGGGTAQQGGMPATQGGGDPSGSGAGMEMGSFWSFFDLEGPQGVAERTKANPVRVRSQQDVAALPKGAHFIDPRDGVTVRVKP